MHLVAAVCSDPNLAHLLRGFRDDAQRFLIHPIPAGAVATVVAALRTLDFAGALVFDPRIQLDAARAAERASLDARELGAADTLTVTPAGVVGDFQLGRAVGAALRRRLWDPRGARAVVLGADLTARAVARELASLGVAHLTVLARDRPEAEPIVAHLAASTSIAAHASAEAAALALLERADLLVRSDATAEVPAHVFGPHLTLVDTVPGPLTPWRRRGLAVGALTIGARDVEAHRIHLALTAVLGPGVPLEPIMALLHGT